MAALEIEVVGCLSALHPYSAVETELCTPDCRPQDIVRAD